ncbi:segregation and condensation protein A [Mobiluncus mulieris]|uniref:Segregation and condensation protein A n=1 Tax=Mobiluncus mulieris TaxID=2052 RepID=A0A7Y0U3N5_9ACTO|nr:ScpA family protein [Mobiluncus mulieris]MCU9969219.1 segregation/condensation protein A [Mobiluncus mulieris]MCU9973609.1 segregation/condensation protein A [Mobiluncus mulieris]MCV0009249.1 segregation/condensation protein A [Mobiluncus mulieris]NMW64635.1 segregation/condensation protein A [Mobiluncus mulieris]NMW74201.1 segregation/condensation protein A [Mobiluncus mulieris]
MSPDSSVKNPSFEVNTAEYTGPFHLLADLVAKRKLDITAFALAEVTSEFLEYIAKFPSLSQATEFLVIAATLLDIKAARLLPGMVETEEDLELLEAQDLLISRLIQYQTYKEAAGFIAHNWDEYGSAMGRVPGAEPLLKGVLASLKTTIDCEDLARRAAGAIFATPPQVLVAHLHDPLVSVTEQSQVLTERLRQAGSLTFRQLVADAKTLPVIISRFLALLDMYRHGHLSFDQEYPLGKLVITWVGKPVESTETVESDDSNATFSDAEGEWQ